MLRLGTHSNRAPFGVSTVGMMETGLTVTHRELNFDRRIGPLIQCGGPADAGTASGASGLLTLPINREILGSKAQPFPGLTTVVAADGAQQFEVVLPITLDNQFGIDKACIGEMHRRQEV